MLFIEIKENSFWRIPMGMIHLIYEIIRECCSSHTHTHINKKSSYLISNSILSLVYNENLHTLFMLDINTIRELKHIHFTMIFHHYHLLIKSTRFSTISFSMFFFVWFEKFCLFFFSSSENACAFICLRLNKKYGFAIQNSMIFSYGVLVQ